MSLRMAVICGMTAAIAVPAILARSGTVQEGWLVGHVVRLPVGGGMELHWSWPIFSVTTLAIWGLLAATRDR